MRELQEKKLSGCISKEEEEELAHLLDEAAKEKKKATKKVSMLDAEPSLSHMVSED